MFHHWSQFRHAKEKIVGNEKIENTAGGSHSSHSGEAFGSPHEEQSPGVPYKPKASDNSPKTDLPGNKTGASGSEPSSSTAFPAALGGVVHVAVSPSVSGDPSNPGAAIDPKSATSQQSSQALGASVDASAPNVCQSMKAGNIFVPISSAAPVVPNRPNHPVSKYAIRSRTTPVSNTNQTPLGPAPQSPLQTNKFYANLFLGEQTNSAWTQPYSLWWSKGRGNANSWGMSVTHIEKNAVARGPNNSYGACNYFFGPIGTILLPVT
jgi:endo-1,3(4)-beta-glucanase